MTTVGSWGAETRDAIDWRIHCRTDPDGEWSDCRLVDITLSGAHLELAHPIADNLRVGDSLFLQFDSFAGDDVGIEMCGVVCGDGASVDERAVQVEFAARREESLLLHLLVRLHSLV